jgi:transposase
MYGGVNFTANNGLDVVIRINDNVHLRKSLTFPKHYREPPEKKQHRMFKLVFKTFELIASTFINWSSLIKSKRVHVILPARHQLVLSLNL